ncbi:auxin-responsive protein IAA13 [Artemisia annua]|uniref:Auxin-responsive protein n=1 Tax=Artemisia annua TaxID=35608 RepID=A0A2U1NKQ6_ARTAN|nr:auxin-responsive protein IAA13 [Artemisia annua]
MDGIPVGRRVDLWDHDSYESLTQKLDDLFRDFGLNTEGVGPSYLLGGTRPSGQRLPIFATLIIGYFS